MQIIQIIQIREYSCPAWQIIQINNCIGNRSSVPSVNTLMNNRICYGTKRLTCKYRVNDVNINNSVVNAKGGEKDACVAPPTKKKCHFVDSLHKPTTGSTSTSCIFLVRHSVILPQLQPHLWSENAPSCEGPFGALTTVWQSDNSFCAV